MDCCWLLGVAEEPSWGEVAAAPSMTASVPEEVLGAGAVSTDIVGSREIGEDEKRSLEW